MLKKWNEPSYPENSVLLTTDRKKVQDVLDGKERELKSLISIDAFEAVACENQVTLSFFRLSLKNIKVVKKKIKEDWYHGFGGKLPNITVEFLQGSSLEVFLHLHLWYICKVWYFKKYIYILNADYFTWGTRLLHTIVPCSCEMTSVDHF